MRLRPERTPEHEQRKAAASLLLSRVALGLVQDARHGGGFGQDEAALRSQAVQLAAKLAADTGAAPEQDPVELELRSGG